jgi:hypothetical protein
MQKSTLLFSESVQLSINEAWLRRRLFYELEAFSEHGKLSKMFCKTFLDTVKLN